MTMTRIPKKVVLGLIIAFVLGAFWLIAMRFIFLTSDKVHYHANFGVYVNGQREAFDSFVYYEEVQACSSDEANNPRTRVHMHDFVSDTVHVHDQAATWGQFFENLGLTLGDDVLVTPDGVFVPEGNNELIFILNGERVSFVANTVIDSEDTLLVSYGPTDTDFAAEYNSVAHTAAEYNAKPDPSSCSGSNVPWQERLKEAIL